ncbi:GDSL-like Lipase/Acylhydrolase [Pedobacter suwonensis]|uniref:GDSL-like Lipase/Acylhydrolase n=1 Tax=Pedobacter suwonensis TaxID=332999 RepID=A0A1I0SY62_9SPHI|nr:SGNH/GDSL hydrolase family protein [Pedobacter suwonensis]SFA44440.1 GDSL-like Lipase/Acylhydrolase [Pedobacter suwonensis]
MKKILFTLGLFFISYLFDSNKTNWVAIGDSITYLNDHLEETGNRVHKGYLSRVTDELKWLNYINKGYNGWTAGAVAEKIERLNIPKAEVYTIFLGTNDWWAGRPVGQIEDYKLNKGNGTFYGSMAIIINKIKKLSPKARIILITPMQRADFVYIADKNNNAYGSYKKKSGQTLEDFANATLNIGAESGFKVIDLYHDKSLGLKKLVKFKRLKIPGTGTYKNYSFKSSFNIPFNPQNDDYPYPPEAIQMTYDGLHPSDSGNQVIANKLIKVLSSLEH